MPNLWGDDEIIQDTLSPEREPLLGQDYMPVPALAQEPYLWIAKATTYYLLKQALLAITEEPCFIAFITNADSSEPYKPQTYKEAISGGDTKQWKKLMENKVNSLTENHT